jgi:hypothetical protein
MQSDMQRLRYFETQIQAAIWSASSRRGLVRVFPLGELMYKTWRGVSNWNLLLFSCNVLGLWCTAPFPTTVWGILPWGDTWRIRRLINGGTATGAKFEFWNHKEYKCLWDCKLRIDYISLDFWALSYRMYSLTDINSSCLLDCLLYFTEPPKFYKYLQMKRRIICYIYSLCHYVDLVHFRTIFISCVCYSFLENLIPSRSPLILLEDKPMLCNGKLGADFILIFLSQPAIYVTRT